MENTELETAVKVSDDKTSTNELSSQPSEVEQLKAIIKAKDNEILKFKDMADRRGNQLKKMKDLSNEPEDKTSESVDTTPLATETKSAYNSDELNAVKEQLFRVQHPEITNEDMGVLKSFNGSLEENYNNPAFKAYMGNVLQERANQQATISRESGVNVASSLNDELNSATDNENLTEYILTNADKFFK